MARARRRRPGSPAWKAFCRRHPKHPFLKQDPLYALSDPIIDAIKRMIPGFFSPVEERFERDLARTASLGFFLREALGVESSDKLVRRGSTKTLKEWGEEQDRAIRNMLTDELRRLGAADVEIKEYWSNTDQQRNDVVKRQDAYVGWLVTNRQFEQESRLFRQSCEDVVRRIGRFPRLSGRSKLEMPLDSEPLDEFENQCADFYRRWGLERMLTWDWPQPLSPDLVGGIRENTSVLKDAGLVIFVPWYLLRGERINLQDVARAARTASVPEHLRDWVLTATKPKGKALGELRYERLGWLRRYSDLALRRRYSSACAQNTDRLDRAFASVMGRGEETVKKLRLELQRRLQDNDG